MGTIWGQFGDFGVTEDFRGILGAAILREGAWPPFAPQPYQLWKAERLRKEPKFSVNRKSALGTGSRYPNGYRAPEGFRKAPSGHIETIPPPFRLLPRFLFAADSQLLLTPPGFAPPPPGVHGPGTGRRGGGRAAALGWEKGIGAAEGTRMRPKGAEPDPKNPEVFCGHSNTSERSRRDPKLSAVTRTPPNGSERTRIGPEDTRSGLQ